MLDMLVIWSVRMLSLQIPYEPSCELPDLGLEMALESLPLRALQSLARQTANYRAFNILSTPIYTSPNNNRKTPLLRRIQVLLIHLPLIPRRRSRAHPALSRVRIATDLAVWQSRIQPLGTETSWTEDVCATSCHDQWIEDTLRHLYINHYWL